jgi:hypothetical protein
MNNQKEFIFRELLILAWSASVQRAKLYVPSGKNIEDSASAFRDRLVNYFNQELLNSYKTTCSEEKHIQNLLIFSNYGTQQGCRMLGPDGYKLGVAQKFLNLILKYLWCIGEIPEPPHCPVDRIIIGKTALRGKVNWTEIKKPCQYKKAIEAIREVALKERLSLAKWELKTFSRR